MGQTFEELIGLHLDDLYGAAVCFTLDEHDAEVLLQEAAIRAFHQLARRGGDSDFERDMLEILVSTHLQRQRRMGRDPFASDVEPVGETMRDAVEFQPFPDDGTPGYRLLKDWMRKIWPDLDPGDRLIVWLADVKRLSHARVAAMVGRDEKDVRNRHYRARLTLSRGAARVLGSTAAEGAEA